MKLHEAFAKSTYRQRNVEQRPGKIFALYDKKQKKYKKVFLGRTSWAGRPEDATFYESVEKVHESLNYTLSDFEWLRDNERGQPRDETWRKYFEELGVEYDELEWHHVAEYYEIHKLVITAKVQRKYIIGEDE